ncbi:TonB-dependent receptor [Massilia sp. B-10]|nr:TonB-dependent receptor [Massilia sp. B-10]
MFGEANYYFTPQLHLTVGALPARQFHARPEKWPLPGRRLSNSASSSLSSTAFTPKYAVTWEVDPAHTVYSSVAKGFRLGGSNVFVPPTTCGPDLEANGIENGPPTYSPDSLWSYEVGSKSRFLNNRVTFNADVFYVKWKNIQQGVYLPTCAYTYNANAGRCDQQGHRIRAQGQAHGLA